MPLDAEHANAPREALCRLDAQERFTYVSQEFAAQLGQPPEALLGRRVWDLYPDAQHGELGRAVQRALADGVARHLRGYALAAGRWVAADLHPDGDGLLVHLRDPHAGQLAEVRAQRLQAVTEALAGALTLSEVMEVVLEAAVPASDAEAGALLLIGEDGRNLELLGQQGYAPDAESRVTRVPLDASTPLTLALRERESLYLEGERLVAQFPHLDHPSVRAGGLQAFLPLVVGREPLGVWQLSFAPGVAAAEVERHFIETLAHLIALALARARLHGELERTVEQRTASLHELNTEMRAYADAVSRDLAPSLRRIRDFADVLARRLLAHLGPDEARFFAHIQSESERMARLIEDLGTFVVSGQSDTPFANVPLGQLVSSVRADLAPLLRQRPVEWRVQDLPTVRGHAPLLRQVFAALFSNALHASGNRETSLIEVGAERGEHEWVVWVRDNGAGLSASQAAALVRAYGQAGGSSRSAQGPPSSTDELGLANVQRIITKHGGQVWAQSQPEGGTAFYFSLPDPARSKAAERPA